MGKLTLQLRANADAKVESHATYHPEHLQSAKNYGKLLCLCSGNEAHSLQDTTARWFKWECPALARVFNP